MIGGNPFVATTKRTQRFAKRKMNIETDAVQAVFALKPFSERPEPVTGISNAYQCGTVG